MPHVISEYPSASQGNSSFYKMKNMCHDIKQDLRVQDDDGVGGASEGVGKIPLINLNCLSSCNSTKNFQMFRSI